MKFQYGALKIHKIKNREMNKIIIGVGVVAVLLLVWLGFRSTTIDYVGVVDDEISQLEGDLLSVKAEVASGTLTPEKAVTIQDRMSTRLSLINSTISANKGVVLSDAQQTQLLTNLTRLQRMLVSYQATLVAVDESVQTLPESKRSKGGGINKTLSESFTDVITAVKDTAIEMTDDYEPDEVMDVSNDTNGIEEGSDDWEDVDGSDEVTEDDIQSLDAIMGDESVDDTENSDTTKIEDGSIDDDLQVN